MQLIKGFVVISNLINNEVGQTALLGELSSQSLTYSREKSEYFNATIPGYNFISFKNIDTTTNEQIIVNQTQVNQILNIVKSCKDYSVGQIRPNDPTVFLNYITAEYTADISGLAFGSLIDDGTIELPEWLSWEDINTGNIIKIWLSDISFSEQYDEYEIVIVPPLDHLDLFFNSFNSTSSLLDTINITQMLDKAEIAKNNKPYTTLESLSYNFVNSLDDNLSKSTYWLFLVYGKAGSSIDNIKDELINYILENSTRTEEQWRIIFPDLFKRTEFIILPRWDKISIPNLSQLAALYSSILNPVECIDFAKTVIPFYEQSFINDNVNILPYDYKALSLLIINGPNNSTGKQKIEELYPDYLPISSTSLDFNRMQILTRDWVLLLGSLIIAAETATESSVTPPGMIKVKRNNILFVSAIYDNINYLIAARSNLFYQP